MVNKGAKEGAWYLLLVYEETPDVNVMYIVKELHFIHDIHNVQWDCIQFLIKVDSLKSVNFLLTVRLLQSCLSISQPMKLLSERPNSFCVWH